MASGIESAATSGWAMLAGLLSIADDAGDGGTATLAPAAVAIQKVQQRGVIGKKRKTTKC